MTAPTQAKFAFAVQGFDNNAFHVVRFSGEEGLSQLYRFEIVLYAQDKDVDFDKILANPATLTIKREQGDIPFHGILESFEQLSHSGPYAFYRAVLVPKAWWLTQTTHNQVFLNKDIEQLLTAVLKDGGLSPGLDFEFALQGSYSPWEYLCQYGETHLAFASRWMERDGLYYYFTQGNAGEKMVITDTLASHGPMPQGERFRYAPPSMMPGGHEEEAVTDFTLIQRRLPRKVQLRDYNHLTPSLELSAEAEVSQSGQGVHYLYGLHFLNNKDGEALARIRAQEFQCREKLFSGVSAIPFLRPGYTFALANHFRDSFNQSYQTVTCRHEGSQEAWLVSGLGLSLGEGRDNLLFYRNNFTAIPAQAQFRAELATDKPKISGSLNAKVDAAASGKYAELDSQGRYKVVLPFDLSGRKDGHASAWVRMAQPYAGEGFGMHLPLHKGCEVLLTFEGGDPDRPVIASAAPNPETQGPVTEKNQTMACLTSSGGNRIHIEDEEGNQRILLHSPTEQSFIRLGSHNDPPGDAWGDRENDTGIKVSTGNELSVQCKSENTVVLGNSNLVILGVNTDDTVGERLLTTIGQFTELEATLHIRFGPEVLDGWAKQKKFLGESWEWAGKKKEKLGEFKQSAGQKIQNLASYVRDHGVVQEQVGSKEILVGSEDKTAAAVDAQEGNSKRLVGDDSVTATVIRRKAFTHRLKAGTVNKDAGSVYNKVGDQFDNLGKSSRASGEESFSTMLMKIFSGEVTVI
jgi:type VI secretion system secreted protein VgrG